MTPPASAVAPRSAVPLRCPGARPLRAELLLRAARRRVTRAESLVPRVPRVRSGPLRT